MIIYKDIISGDEMFSDIYKITESPNGILLEVEGKMVSRTVDIDDALIGGNASSEGLDEGSESTTLSGIDIILNHKLQETSFSKESYKAYIKEYMKSIKTKLEENNPDRVKPFMVGAQDAVKKIMGNMKNFQFFTGETMSTEGMVGLLDFREDGITPFMTFFKDGLEIEKC
ncbi:hypothetical protein SKAU_G00231560 [Synaphobranchus kaupii]|uniref:TCTP domain-containing protein n=1 Tax=Synaphobranchus kaupii TaxID=118154 RepID=A0A9Q1F5V3_SYNKA|nr:hypothetical protein SKAU_G00231560 [Synaphobranchus kaupii]